MPARSPVAALAILAALACRAEAGEREIYRWTGDLGPSQTLRVRDLNGAIRVERSAGAQAEVVVTARWRGAEPEGVRVVRAAGAAGTTFCALWPARGHTCEPDGRYGHDGSVDGKGVSLHFTVRVPAGTRLDLSTVNGGIDIDSAGAGLEARTVNGAIRARLSRPPARGQVSLHTVNGAIRLDIAGAVDADLRAKTVNGTIHALGRRHQRRVHTQLGKGGLDLHLETTNGSIHIDATPHTGLSPMWNGCGDEPFQIGIIRSLPCGPGQSWPGAAA